MLESFFFTFLAEESSEILKKWIELFVHQHIQISFELKAFKYPSIYSVSGNIRNIRTVIRIIRMVIRVIQIII